MGFVRTWPLLPAASCKCRDCCSYLGGWQGRKWLCNSLQLGQGPVWFCAARGILPETSPEEFLWTCKPQVGEPKASLCCKWGYRCCSLCLPFTLPSPPEKCMYYLKARCQILFSFPELFTWGTSCWKTFSG